MAKKLTLNIDDELITFAHSYSRQNGLSISKLFEQYLNRLRTTDLNRKLNPKTTSLYGLFLDSTIPDKKITKGNHFMKKNTN
jgi:hypothetical protein